MKKILFTLAFLMVICTGGIRPAYAVDVVFDPASFVESLIDYLLQGLQLGEETTTAGAGVLGAAQQTLSTVNDNVLIPARDTLTLISVIRSGEMVKNLVLGSLGVDPLLVRNPEKYLRGKGQEVIRGVIEDPSIQDSIKDVSVLQSIVSKARYDTLNLTSKIKTISNSQIPQIEQNSRCTDAALSSQAIKDVSGSDGTYSQSDYTARKKEINNALCGDVNNPNTQAALLAVAKNDVNWQSWLQTTTQGDNKWNRSIAIKEEVARRQAEVVAAAKTDLELGKGVKSETKCTKRLRAGDDSSPCLESIIAKTGDILNTTFKDSLTSPLKMQMAGFGKGAGSLLSSVSSIASTAFTTIGLINGISSGLGNSSSDGNGSSGNNAPLVIATTHTNDLINNPQTRNTITNAPKEQLNDHKKALSDLVSINDKFLGTVAIQKYNLDSMKQCYDSLIAEYANDNPNLKSDPRVLRVYDFYNQQVESNASQKSKIETEKNLTLVGITLINGTLSKIEASQSSEEILDLFLNYQTQLKDKNIPGITSAITKQGEYVPYAQGIQQAVKDGGDIFAYNKTCAAMTQEQILLKNNGGGTGSAGGQ